MAFLRSTFPSPVIAHLCRCFSFPGGSFPQLHNAVLCLCLSGLFLAAALQIIALHSISLPLPSLSTRLNATAFRCYAKASLGYALPMPRTAYHCHRSSPHVIAFAKLNKTILRSTIADLCSSFADRCTTLPVNANANPLDSFPSRLQTLPCQCQTMRCPCCSTLRHCSSKPCRCSTQPRLRSAIQSFAFADQILSLPPQCQSRRNYAAAFLINSVQLRCSSNLNRSILCRRNSAPGKASA